MPSGGHLGFCFHQVARDDERLILVDKNKSHGSSSWMPVELARFFQHVMNFKVENDRHAHDKDAVYSQRLNRSELPTEVNVEDAFIEH
jgi:hypothetical protein